MKYNNLCLVITDKCNAECDFCGFSCSPKNKQFMDSEMMERIIREAKQLGIKTIGFSGGEPFLNPELLIKGVKIAREENLNVSIATNGFWGAWEPEKIKSVLTQAKPDVISISYDFFHSKYITQETVFTAVSAAEQLGIPCSIYVADLKGDYSAGRFIQSLGSAKYGRPFEIYPLFRVGRAENMPPELFLTENGREKVLGCLYENTMSVLYNGDVYPCCMHEVFGSAMKYGNVKTQSLKEVMDNSDVPKICSVLMRNERFQKLIDIAESQGIVPPEYVGCGCDYCRMLFKTEENKRIMLPYVEEMYGKMLVNSLMKEVQNNVVD